MGSNEFCVSQGYHYLTLNIHSLFTAWNIFPKEYVLNISIVYENMISCDMNNNMTLFCHIK